MKIKVLGTRGEIEESAPYHSKKSGILIDNVLLLDCGEERFLHYNPQYILITHLHPDHAFFVRHKELIRSSASLYAPEKYDGLDIRITDAPFKINGYKITPIPTDHSIKVKSNAYLIEYGDKKILYTGDMIWINKEYHHLIPLVDLVITEASFMRTGGMIRRDQETGRIFGHAGVPNLVKLFKAFTHKIVFVHFGSWFYGDIKKARNQFKKMAEKNGIEIIVGYDGLELTI